MSENASASPSSPTCLPASCPSVYFNYTMKTLECAEWLPAVSHKPLIVLWSWIVAFYHPATVKGTFATGVSCRGFSGNANGLQGPPFLYQTFVILFVWTEEYYLISLLSLQFLTILQLTLYINEY